MKYLSDYTSAAQTELFKSSGVIFAFSQQQFDEQKKDGVKYVLVGAGLICPKANIDELHNGLDSIQAAGVAADISENGVKAIIHRELANHEAQISCSCSDTIEALADYPSITPEMIRAEYPAYFDHCVKNNFF